MSSSARLSEVISRHLALLMLALLLAVLVVAGGASKATAIGQVVVRATSVAMLIVALLFCPRAHFRDAKPVWVVLGAAIALILVQLVPLPPDVWQALPGRRVFIEAALASGQQQPWRPWAVVPGAALNAAASLIVPLAVLTLIGTMRREDRAWLPGLLLATIVPAMFVGLLQFTGTEITNRLVNAEPGMVDGLFANRNHFALFLAIGCVVAPAWAFSRNDQRSSERPHSRWRGPVALALMLLCLLVILASGSRAGMPLGVLGIGAGLLLARTGIRRALDHYSLWAFRAFIVGVVATFAAFVLASVLAGRAASIDRVLTLGTAGDLRARNLPIVLAMVRDYFPAGAGFGGFDTLFRIREPLSFLQPEYFNHAHNDLVEVVLDGGLAGLLLLLGALGWWARASLRVWLSPSGSRMDARMGSAVLFLVLIASFVDYPARTPIIMTVVVIAAWCLAFRGTQT